MHLSSVRRGMIGGLLIWALTIAPATANAWPPMAIWLLQVPLSAGLISYGVGVVAIALLEGFILSGREKLALRRSLVAAGWANLCSLALGLLVIMGFAALPYSILGKLFLAIAYVLLIGFSSVSVPYFQFDNLRPYPAGRILVQLLIWGGSWFVILSSSLWLITVINTLNPGTVSGKTFPDTNVPFYVNFLQLLAVMLFVAIGFAMSVVSEGFCLMRLLPEVSEHLWQTVVVMNLRSYAYVAIPITLIFLIFR